jgi:catechol 2,3-dioxygenase-like lactoylglutathione lyase family enzyme
MDMKLEAVVLPISDVDRAKHFYQALGWRLDADFPFDNGVRVIQLTPPGSGCSIQSGTVTTDDPLSETGSTDPIRPAGFITQPLRRTKGDHHDPGNHERGHHNRCRNPPFQCYHS